MGILSFTCQADTVAPSARSNVRMVDTKCHLTIGNMKQRLGLGSCLVDVIDIAVSRIVELTTYQ